MHQSVIPFPGQRARPADDGPTCHFRTVTVQLGCSNKGSAYKVAYIRMLMRDQGFPAPLPRFIHSRAVLMTGADAVYPNARWQRAAVDAWFEGLLPPGARNALTTAEAAEVDATIAARLANMGAGA